MGFFLDRTSQYWISSWATHVNFFKGNQKENSFNVKDVKANKGNNITEVSTTHG